MIAFLGWIPARLRALILWFGVASCTLVLGTTTEVCAQALFKPGDAVLTAYLEAPEPGSFQVGDAVEAHGAGKWWPATVTEVHPGEYFPYKIRFDAGPYKDRTILRTAREMRAARTTEQPARPPARASSSNTADACRPYTFKQMFTDALRERYKQYASVQVDVQSFNVAPAREMPTDFYQIGTTKAPAWPFVARVTVHVRGDAGLPATTGDIRHTDQLEAEGHFYTDEYHRCVLSKYLNKIN